MNCESYAWISQPLQMLGLHLPVLLRVAIGPTCWTHELVTESGWFGLSVLSRGQEQLAIECGTRSGRDEDKFRRLNLT